jgi:hypothetical protein
MCGIEIAQELRRPFHRHRPARSRTSPAGRPIFQMDMVPIPGLSLSSDSRRKVKCQSRYSMMAKPLDLLNCLSSNDRRSFTNVTEIDSDSSNPGLRNPHNPAQKSAEEWKSCANCRNCIVFGGRSQDFSCRNSFSFLMWTDICPIFPLSEMLVDDLS